MVVPPKKYDDKGKNGGGAKGKGSGVGGEKKGGGWRSWQKWL